MREIMHVEYKLHLIDRRGEEIFHDFSHDFDSELYHEDIDGIDLMMVNFEMDKVKDKYGDDVLLIEFDVNRGGRLLH